jgi:H+/Cl- antiporter ClcA
MKQIGWKYYIVFCCILALLLTIVYFVFPETKGHTLEKIAEIFDGKKHTPGSEDFKIEKEDPMEKEVDSHVETVK